MNFLIDITEYFGAIDFDNAGGVISYIISLQLKTSIIAFNSKFLMSLLT